jgi:hypothetical protein
MANETYPRLYEKNYIRPIPAIAKAVERYISALSRADQNYI